MCGLTDLNTFEFKKPAVENTIRENALTYDRDMKKLLKNDRGKSKVYCDINRVCEIEDASVEWLDIT